MSNVPEQKKCTARDHGKRCQRKKTRRGYCKKHYDRWLRHDGETRLQSELKAIKARVAWRQRDIDLARAIGEKVVDPIFGPITSDDKGDDPE